MYLHVFGVGKWSVFTRVTVLIVTVNPRFLELPQRRSRENQLIYRRLTRTKSIGSGQDPESQTGRQSGGYGGWCLELRREARRYGRMGKTRASLLNQNNIINVIKRSCTCTCLRFTFRCDLARVINLICSCILS